MLHVRIRGSDRFVDQTAEDIAAVDLLGGWRLRHALAL
jgi:hypothetical protein